MFMDSPNRRSTSCRVLLSCVLGLSLLSVRTALCMTPHVHAGHALRSDLRHLGNKQCLEHTDAPATTLSAVRLPELIPQYIVDIPHSLPPVATSVYGAYYNRPPPS
jgi:hypothetical protein